MTVQEFYECVGGDYKTAQSAFGTEEKLLKFLGKYSKDPSYARLCKAAEAGDVKEAFKGAHAMKGLAGMFYLTDLYEVVCALVEQLRPQDEPIDESLYQNVKEGQQLVLDLLESLLSE